MADNLNELMKPTGTTPPADEPVIHVIPEKFYGLALRKKVPRVVPTAPPKPVGPPKPPTAPPKPKKSGGNKIFIIAVVVFVLLVGAGVAAFFLLGPKPAKVVPVVNTKPPAPVCGNGKCEAPETYLTCPADCPPPAPVCGNGKCEAPMENYQNCPADCPPPAPVCGDGKCDAPAETWQNCPADCPRPAPTPGVDSDSDGLTDLEETAIYHSDPNNPDSSKCGYLDGNQVAYLYDPASTVCHSLLKNNPGITTYQNSTLHYSVLQPSSWTVREDVANNATYFTASDSEVVEVQMMSKPVTQSLSDWYLAQAPAPSGAPGAIFKTLQKYDAVSSPDHMTTYVDLGDHVAVVTYGIGDSVQIQFKTTFQMMVASLTKLP
jgi:hypothetical protein